MYGLKPVPFIFLNGVMRELKLPPHSVLSFFAGCVVVP